jgi:hypothetical protein
MIQLSLIPIPWMLTHAAWMIPGTWAYHGAGTRTFYGVHGVLTVLVRGCSARLVLYRALVPAGTAHSPGMGTGYGVHSVIAVGFRGLFWNAGMAPTTGADRVTHTRTRFGLHDVLTVPLWFDFWNGGGKTNCFIKQGKKLLTADRRQPAYLTPNFIKEEGKQS